MNRAERRQRLRDLEKLQDDIARHGLPPSTSLQHLAAMTASLSSILGKRSDASRASRAAAFVHGIVDRSIAGNPETARLHCRKGCAYCCKNYVSALAPQVFAVANFIRRDAPDPGRKLEEIRAAEALTRGLGVDERSAARLPCALLVQDACTVYEHRPIVCRTYVSTDLGACERAFAGGPDAIPMPTSFMDLRGACDQSLWAALYGHGLDDSGYELNHAVLIALEAPDAEARWLAGENVFAEVKKDDSLARIARHERELFWKVLLALSRGEDPPVSSWNAPGA